jgi:hypothetical protein
MLQNQNKTSTLITSIQMGRQNFLFFVKNLETSMYVIIGPFFGCKEYFMVHFSIDEILLTDAFYDI